MILGFLDVVHAGVVALEPVQTRLDAVLDLGAVGSRHAVVSAQALVLQVARRLDHEGSKRSLTGRRAGMGGGKAHVSFWMPIWMTE